MGINVGKALKEIATDKNIIVNETKQLGRGLDSGADLAKALEAFMKNNKDNPAVLKFMEGLNAEIQNNPSTKQVTKAIASKLKNYVPLENNPMRIVTNSGIKTIIPKGLSPEAVKAITKLHGEPKFWNSNKGVSIGDVDNIYDPNIADTLVAAYNKTIKKPEILELLKGKPFNKDLVGKIIYNGLASASWGSGVYDATKVANRANGISENGNPDSILTNPAAMAGAAAFTRGVFPFAKFLRNPGIWGMGADLFVPAVVGKAINIATSPDTDQGKTNATDATDADALKDNKGNTRHVDGMWVLE